MFPEVFQQTLALHPDMQNAPGDGIFAARWIVQRKIEETDKEIDNLVYRLYGLTEDEIKVVEESFNRT